MVEEKKISKARACRVLGLNRSTFTYKHRPKNDEALSRRMQERAQQHRRWGVVSIHGICKREGLVVNRIRNGAVHYRRNAIGQIERIKLQKAMVEYSYDSSYGELSKIEAFYGGRSIFRREYKRDLLGRIVLESGGRDWIQFLYDKSGRYLGKRKEGAYALLYENRYDDNNNRVYAKTPDGESTGAFDRHDRQLIFGNFSFTYNEHGDLETMTNDQTSAVTTYLYDVSGNLKQVVLPSTQEISYLVDGFNRRVAKKVDGVLSERYLYQDDLKIAAMFDGSDSLQQRYFYGDSMNSPDALLNGQGWHLLVKDPRGSVLMIVDTDSGEIRQRILYDDWGKVVSDTAPGYQPFGFAGGIYDSSTGLVRFGVRDYDPETGRWTAKDPILFEGGDLNLYGYALHDPINFTDADGKAPCVRDGILQWYKRILTLRTEISRLEAEFENQEKCTQENIEAKIRKLRTLFALRRELRNLQSMYDSAVAACRPPLVTPAPEA
jgi:RHS repeat-associated protein